MGIMSKHARVEHDAVCEVLIHRWPLPAPLPSVDEVMELAMRDSKRGITSEDPGEITDVLLREMGDVLPSKTSNLTKFPSKLFQEWLELQNFPVHSENVAQKAAGFV